MLGSPASPSRDDLAGLLGATASFWPPPPWLNLLLAAIVGLFIHYVLNLFTSSSHYNTQEKLKKYKKNNNKNVSSITISMPNGYGPFSSLLSTVYNNINIITFTWTRKKSSRSFGIKIGSITALVAAFLVYTLSDLTFKAQRFDAAVVEVGNAPPPSLPLDLPPPPIDIFGELAIEEVFSEYEDTSSSFSPHTPMARASFLKVKAISLLRGAIVQIYFGPVNTGTNQQQEEGIEDGIFRVGTPEVTSGSVDLLPLFKSGFQFVGFKGYDQMMKDVSGRVRTLFQSLSPKLNTMSSDGGPSSSAFFSMASLRSKAVGFLSGTTPVWVIFEKSVEDATTVSVSVSDKFATQTEFRIIEFVGNTDVHQLKSDTSIKYASCTCPTDVHLRYKRPVDKDGDGQRLGGLTKWINRVLLASSDDNCDGFCMKVSKDSGDWPYSADESTNSYQDEALYCLLKKASNPTILDGLDVDSATKKACLLDVFSYKCVGSDKVLSLKNKAASFIKDRTMSLLSGAPVRSYLDLQQEEEGDLENDSIRVEHPVEGASGSVSNPLLPSGYQFGFKGYYQMTPFDSDPPSVCVTVPSPNDISKEVGHSGPNMSKASVSSTLGLNEKVQLHNPSLPWWYLVLILGAVFELYGISKSMFALQEARDMSVSRQSPQYSLRKNKKARQMYFTRLVQLFVLSITLSNVLMSGISAYALEIGENLSGDNLMGESGEHDPNDDLKDNYEMSSDISKDEYEKVKMEDHVVVAPDGHDTPSDLMPAVEKFEDHLLPVYDDSEDDEFDMMIEEYEQELGDRASDKAQLWPTESSVKSSDMALVEKGLSSSEMKELEEFRRQQLRGSIEGDVNHLAIIPRIVDFLQHRVDEAKALKNIILNGNVAEATAALSIYFDNTQAVAKIASSVDGNEEHALDLSVTNEEGQLHGRKLQAFLSEVAPDELVDILHLNDDGIDEMEHYVNVMEDVERKLFPGSNRSRRSTQNKSHNLKFSFDDKLKKPKLPKLKVVEQLKAKRGIHGRRRLQEVAPQCREKCQSDDYKCNCQLLVDYARKLTWYDASVMFLGGFVQGDPDVDGYGELNVEFISKIDVFDVRNQLPETMQSIKDKADEAETDMSVDSCRALLSELHTACDEDTCTEPNMDSFPLSVNQVGSSVNTHTKLKVEAIGEFYDFQRLTVRRDDTGNNEIANTPLNERRPVHCCRDDEPTGNEEIWYKSPIAVSASLADVCPYAWEQKWTGDVAIPALPVLSTFRMNQSVYIYGRYTYTPSLGTYTVKSSFPPTSSAQISGTKDVYYYFAPETTGEIDMRLRVTDYTGTESNHCAGLMIRQSKASGAIHFSILYCGDKRIQSFRRTTENRDTDSSLQTDVIEGDVWLRITKRPKSSVLTGIRFDSFTAYTSSDGTDWTILGAPWNSNQFRVGNSNFYVGVAVSTGTLEASDFIINDVPAIPIYLPSTPTVVEGYTSYNQRICNNDNQFLNVAGFEEDEDGSISVSSAQECASHCNESLDCVSFDFFGISCRLSSSCDHFSNTDPNPASQWYFKNVAPPLYMKFAGRLCTTSASDLASANANSVQECANQCSEDHRCVSFAYPTTNGSTECQLSSTCHDFVNMSANNSWNTYVKRDEDDDEDEDVCPFLPYAQAEEYCADAGGRLCTRSELEDGCASFMGCNFDTANVWSSTETEPIVCPATYQETCNDFTTAFESLYNGRNRTIFQDENPMRIDPSQPIDLASDNVHWLRCVRYNGQDCNNPNKTPTLASNNEVHPIACCSDTSNTDPWRMVNPTGLSPMPPDWCPYQLHLEFSQIPKADQCKSGTFDEANAFCSSIGGRLCSSAEFENNCVAGSGCGWSRNNELGEVAWTDDQSNTQFPTAYNWIIDTHGVASIYPDNTYEYAVLSNNPADLFCGVTQGPPSELAKACDASMEFLLGRGVSIGLLTSTANEVNDFDPDEPTPEPRWLTWYANQTDTNSIESFNEWTDAYLNIEDPGGDPIWMEDYLSIQDEDPFILSQSQTFSDTEILSMDEIYCIDKSISGDDKTLQICQRAWLDDKTNRYSDMTWYTSIPYPSSDVAPYNESCEVSFCNEDWLESDQNPFSEDTNAGCHVFWGYCRGYDPSRYQCGVFWDYCRTEQDSRNPGWKYPRENCTDPSISPTDDIVTCPTEWLNNTVNPYTDEREQNESCYNFWMYCRNELDEINPDWVYPRPTCNDDNGIGIETCQITWLDDDENPYSSTNDPECYEFWDFCRLELLTKHERYAWPFPAEPTVDDLLPGYCCLDTPAEDRTTKFWGDHYTAARSEAGMKCANRGFWYMGMSAEACHNGGGQFFRTACITLQGCIDARPRKGEDGYKDSFEEWVLAEGIEIYDPSDQEQCEQARVALNYDADYYNDYEVCETFDELLCDEFFDDLQWLEDIASNGPIEFVQVTYQDIEYPEDKPLFFQELPNEVPIKDADVDLEDSEGSTAEEVVRKALSIAKGNAFDAINKYKDVADGKKNTAKAKCDAAELKYNILTIKWRIVYLTCRQLCTVLPGMAGTNPACNPCQAQEAPVIAASAAAGKAHDTCKLVVLTGLEGFLAANKIGLWITHWLVKVAYEAVDNLIFDWQIKESQKVKEYDYTKAIYDNTKGQFGWIHDALGVMTNNNIKQHIQMREELQNRHQDITNDVNRYTTCMSNFLGIQIYNALPGTRTGPLSSTCQNTLGVSGRRLEEGGPFKLDVEFLSESFVVKQDKIMAKEDDIVNKQEKIMAKEDDMMNMLVDMNSIVSALRDRMITLQGTVDDIAVKLDMDPGQPRENDSKSKKSKKAKQVKPEVPDESDEGDLFTRNLLGVKEAANGKFDNMERQVKATEGKVESMEGKVESIDVKVGSMEGKIESIEGKVESIENTMEELKDMLSQLMMRGADVV